jgi:dienelactone hydrolase
MLHGSAGAFSLKSTGEPPVDNFGEKVLAKSCFAVVLPHYLEAIGHRNLTSREEMAAHFPELLTATGILLSRAENLPWVKGRAVFLFGESLGGYLGVALAFERSDVSAVSEFGGGLPTGYSLMRRRRPSVLISHGGADTLVPLSEAESLRGYCVANGIPVEMSIYQGESHYLSPSVRMQVLSQTVEFFKRMDAPDRRAKTFGQAHDKK